MYYTILKDSVEGRVTLTEIVYVNTDKHEALRRFEKLCVDEAECGKYPFWNYTIYEWNTPDHSREIGYCHHKKQINYA